MGADKKEETQGGNCLNKCVSAVSSLLPNGVFLPPSLMATSYQLPDVDLTGKVAIVTGANTGIGKETARGLATRGATVILACRNVKKGEAAAKEIGGRAVRVIKCDLASFASVREFCRQVSREEKKVDILINNAGMVTMKRELTEDGQEMQFQSNHLGHFLLTNLLLEKMKASREGARIINVSSVAHWVVLSFPWDDLTWAKSWYNGWSAYSISKLANVLFTKELVEKLKGSKIRVYSLHPGGVYTDLGRNLSGFIPDFVKSLIGQVNSVTMLSAESGAKTSLFCALEPSLDTPEASGKYYDNCKEASTSWNAKNKDMAKKLWEVSKEIVQLN